MTEMLMFTPYAWAKLHYMRDVGDTEVGGFGISRVENPLLVEDFVLPLQDCRAASVDFDEEGFIDYCQKMADAGLRADQYMRLWIHTHPGNSASPSQRDLTSWNSTFADMSWAVMFILAKGGAYSCKYRSKNHIMALELELQAAVNWNQLGPYALTPECYTAWKAEYTAAVQKKTYGGHWSQGNQWNNGSSSFQTQGYIGAAGRKDDIGVKKDDKEIVVYGDRRGGTKTPWPLTIDSVCRFMNTWHKAEPARIAVSDYLSDNDWQLIRWAMVRLEPHINFAKTGKIDLMKAFFHRMKRNHKEGEPYKWPIDAAMHDTALITAEAELEVKDLQEYFGY